MFAKKIKRFTTLSFIAAIVLLLAGCGTTNAPTETSTGGQIPSETHNAELPAVTVELTISAAASLTDALSEIQQNYEANTPSVKLVFNFGASGALQRQIENGAPADLFLSAAPGNMNALVDQGLIEASQQTKLLRNELVAVIPADGGIPVESMTDLTKAEVKTIAIGIPESVPAGNYAKEALTAANLWDQLQERTVQAKDVRQVLQYVESGNVEVGFVYKTDALTSEKAAIAFAVDPELYPPVEYPIGIVKATKSNKEAEEFYMYLQTKEALDIFVKYGFSLPE